MPKSSLDWLGVVSAWIGAIVLAFKSASAPLPSGAPNFFASSIWNFVPAALLSLALLIFIYRQFVPVRRTTEAPNVSPAPASKATKAAKSASTSEPRKGAEPRRVYVSASLSPYDLMDMTTGKTHVEGQRILAPYLGKWMRVAGVFADLSVNEYFSIVSLERKEAANIDGISIPTTHTVLFYFRKDRDRLEVLRVGDRIVIHGQIKEIEAFTFKLDNCELIEESA